MCLNNKWVYVNDLNMLCYENICFVFDVLRFYFLIFIISRYLEEDFEIGGYKLFVGVCMICSLLFYDFWFKFI